MLFDVIVSRPMMATHSSFSKLEQYFQAQRGDGNELIYPVAILRQSLTHQHTRWHAAEKEVYAIYWAITKLRHLLLDRKFLFKEHHIYRHRHL